MKLTELNSNLISCIFSYLDLKTIFTQVPIINKGMREQVKNGELWKSLFNQWRDSEHNLLDKAITNEANFKNILEKFKLDWS
jgi:hypothetical protein